MICLKEIESIRKPLEQDRDAKLAQLRKELEVQHTQVRTIAFYFVLTSGNCQIDS